MIKLTANKIFLRLCKPGNFINYVIKTITLYELKRTGSIWYTVSYYWKAGKNQY